MRWSDIDLDAATISLRRSRVDRWTIRSSRDLPDEAGEQWIALDSVTMSVLRSRKSAQAAKRLVMGEE